MSDRMRWWSWRLMAAATSCVIAFSALRGIRNGYQAIGDNALIELRGRDVLTINHPWLGTWSSASISAGTDVNHPGPLLFDLVALPVRLFGGGAGIAVAIALLNIVIVWSVGFVAVRIGGATAALTAQVITAGLAWTLGSELLYDPWQPNVLILPFWLLVMLVWAVVADDVKVLPFAVAVASFTMETHLGYLFFSPLLIAFALVVVVLRRRRRGPERFADLRRPVTIAVIVGVVLWAQPLWEQFFGAGSGNLHRLLAAGTGRTDGGTIDESRTGIALAVRLFSSVVTQPPWWGRSGFDTSVPGSTWLETPDGLVLQAPGLAGFGVALVWLVAGLALVGLGWWAAHRHGARSLVCGYWVLAMCSAVAFATIVITPLDWLGLSPHKVRYLWVIGAFATYLLVMTGLTVLRERPRRIALGALTVAGALAVVATVPFHANAAGPVFFRATYGAVEDLRDQIETWLATDPDAPDRILFDAEGIGFAEPYTAPVMAEFLEDGVDLLVAHPTLARQLGNRRLAGPDDAGLPVVFVRVGAEALQEIPGVRRIAFHDGERTPYSVLDIRDRAVAVFISDDGVVPGPLVIDEVPVEGP